MDTFLSITISLCLLMFLVCIYLTWTICRIKQINKQINMHKETKLSSKNIMTFIPLMLISNAQMIAIDLLLFILLIFLVGLSVYLNELYEKKMKILIEILEEEKNERMESKRSL